ncbi:MAG: hypothetical protein A2X32_00125 [Elusimicrobia bacterium GWC2_64_44]|nr:MAG: hypothetical protein A2X32_00125 [Elusimicrobia bacterium GWC2_64_44]
MTTHTKTEKKADLEQLISDYGSLAPGKEEKTSKDELKYRDIVRAMQWARHLRRQEDARTMTMAELIDKALFDVVNHDVLVDQIEEAVKKDAEIEDKLSTKRSDDSKRIRKEPRDEKPAKDAA